MSSFSQSVDWSNMLLVLASWSLIWKHCRAAERHWKADQSHRGRTGLDIVSCGGLGFDVILLTLQDGRPYTSVCLSMCLHSVKCAQRTWKHTQNGVKKRKEISTHVTEEPKITHLVVSRSHSPFFNFSFSIVVASRPATKPLKTSLSDCQMSWKLLRSVFSLLLLLQCIVGSAVRYSKHTHTNQCLLYIVCVNARWESSHAARRRKPQSHLYIVLFQMFVRMCVGVCMRVFNNHHSMWKRKKKDKLSSSTTTDMVGRRGDLSSPVLLCNESYLVKQKHQEKMGSKNKNGKCHTIIDNHTWVIWISRFNCFGSPHRSK